MNNFKSRFSFYSFQFLLLFIFVFMLFFPQKVFLGTCRGLILWYKTVLPTLFPFMVITNLLINSKAVMLIVKYTGPIIHKIFHTSAPGTFAVIVGFLGVYPMGSKVIADLYIKKQGLSNPCFL